MHAAAPSRTAFRVALRRAAHQVQDAPPLILTDPIALQIIGPEGRVEVARTPAADRRPFSAALRAFMVARSRLAEDMLAEAYARGTRQYLLLGAGLDTFAYRNPHPGLHVFEVDHPATQAWKLDLLATARIPIPASAHHVAVDFESRDPEQNLASALVSAGLDLAQPVATAWLGVVPYLTPAAFAHTTRVLAGFAPGSTLLFDYALPRESLPPVEQLMFDSLASRVQQAGEPFQLFFTPGALRDELAAAGLRVLSDVGSAEVNAQLFRNRTDGLHLRGQAGRICTAVLDPAA